MRAIPANPALGTCLVTTRPSRRCAGGKHGSRARQFVDAGIGGFERKDEKDSNEGAEEKADDRLGVFVLPKAADEFYKQVPPNWCMLGQNGGASPAI